MKMYHFCIYVVINQKLKCSCLSFFQKLNRVTTIGAYACQHNKTIQSTERNFRENLFFISFRYCQISFCNCESAIQERADLLLSCGMDVVKAGSRTWGVCLLRFRALSSSMVSLNFRFDGGVYFQPVL
jgi:hypothetical protein